MSPIPETDPSLRPDTTSLRKAARSAYSRAGFAGLTLAGVTTVLQLLTLFGLPAAFPGIDQNPVFIWLATFAPLYLIALPLACAVLCRLPAARPAPHRMNPGQLGISFLMCVALMYFGNLIGSGLSALLSGGSAQNPLASLVSETSPIQVLVTVLLAPILEELFFRKLFLDRLARYGTGLAVVASALGFALFHMNLFQFFYAFALGLLFAYLYLRTGLLRYSILMHVAINFVGTVLSVQAVALGEAVLVAYAIALIGCAVAGLVLLLLNRKKFSCPAASDQLPKGAGSVAFCNPGVLLYTLLCAAVVVLALFG